MALKKVQRVTFSLPKSTLVKLNIKIPKAKRSKYIASIIEKDLETIKSQSFSEAQKFWQDFRKKYPVKLEKSIEEIIREDHLKH